MRKPPKIGMRQFRGAIKALPPRQAMYVTLWAEGWSYQDIAIAMKLKDRASIGKTVRAGLETVKKQLQT